MTQAWWLTSTVNIHCKTQVDNAIVTRFKESRLEMYAISSPIIESFTQNLYDLYHLSYPPRKQSKSLAIANKISLNHLLLCATKNF